MVARAKVNGKKVKYKDSEWVEDKSDELLITLNEGRSIFIYKDKETDLIKSSNIPHLNVEDQKNWKSYNTSMENPNLIGQIHSTNEGVKFHLCYSPNNKMIGKDELKAIIKGIEYVEEFIKSKK